MINIVLVHPEIPPNTGNIIRLCANTGAKLHLIKPLGFTLDDKHLLRAGLDYHEYAHLSCYDSWQLFKNQAIFDPSKMYALSSKCDNNFFDRLYDLDTWLVFGSETRGLPPDIRQEFAGHRLVRLPMLPGQRSLNLANSVAIAVYELWRQQQFNGAEFFYQGI
ncbi:MAG: tRNA (cytidine(34)-2'-O)-methyltransferase [Gammaproteobacteria bacterium]|nr:tRNA (cytidine(34)-2'-O)-methyltransferase [Gammaproteobacteria bacterium]